MEPRDVGLEDTEIVLNARSGRHALRHRIEELGYNLTPNDIEQAYERFLELADKKKEIFDEDLIEIVGGKSDEESLFYQLDYLHTVSGTGYRAYCDSEIENRQRGYSKVGMGRWSCRCNLCCIA